MVIVAYALALLAIAWLLERMGVPAPLAATIVILVALAWLSWPIWLSPRLGGPNRQAVVAWLVGPHPLFALNSILKSSHAPVGVWLQQPIAYD